LPPALKCFKESLMDNTGYQQKILHAQLSTCFLLWKCNYLFALKHMSSGIYYPK
jgi:hypothetical protein